MARTPDVYHWGPLDLGTKQPCSVSWGLEDLIDACEEQTENTLAQHRHRKLWHPEDVESVVLFLARYGTLPLRQELVRQSFAKKPSVPTSLKEAGLKEAVLYKVQYGTNELRQRVLLSALSGGGRKRVRERVGKKRARSA